LKKKLVDHHIVPPSIVLIEVNDAAKSGDVGIEKKDGVSGSIRERVGKRQK